jgi:ribosome recycling factor
MSNYKEIVQEIEPDFQKVITFLEGEIIKIRTSLLSPSLVENIKVKIDENELSIRELGTISLVSSGMLLIQPWDKLYIQPIEKAINESNLGINPIASKDGIRLSAPALSQDYRDNLIRILSEKKEDARKTIRHFREEVWKKIQDDFKKSEIREDDKFKAKDELQKLVDKYNDKIEEMIERKKKEIQG